MLSERAREQLEALFKPVLDPVIYWLDNLGNLITLTGKTLFWLVRPPYRISQFINA
ncbi:MAG TPA: ABC transporter permease, partial [Polyangiaceae bacterium]|nr:ABC transporter permease [Polyangiaceae bacterium]